MSSSKPPHPGPSSFIGGKSYLSPNPQPQPARVVDTRPVLPRAAPSLTVSMAKRVFVSKEMVAALNLKNGQLLSLHAPERRGDPWLLDTRPALGRPFRLALIQGNGRFTRTCEIGREQLGGFLAQRLPGTPYRTQTTPDATLRLVLGPPLLSPAYPRGIFVLHPAKL